MKKYDLDFENTRNLNIEKMGGAPELDNLSREWMKKSAPYNYVYNFDWMNTPIIQFPQDIVAMQELIFKHEPDLIIETGVARGGSVLFSASMLSLLDLRKSLKDNVSFERKRKVIGIDIDIREHTRQAINDEPLSYITIKGRWQVVSKSPKIILDIGHNKQCVEELKKQLENEKFNKLHLIIGFSNDKNLEAIISTLPNANLFYLTKSDNSRSVDPELI